ncbi:MAG TPA: phenylacetate--CoA ligase family protein [Streptosporangiaceae bacterium]|nr:phenylacetate--CoA ligase family protein [Streptosporangiaceae bacterium]
MDRLSCVRLANSAASHSLPAFRVAGRAGRLASSLSAQAARTAARSALATVPAYADFVGEVPPRAPAAEWVRALPVTDKKSYIDAYPLAARCRHGVVPATGAELDESSGTSGRPYTWVRSKTELTQVRRRLALLVRYILDSEPGASGPLVTINAFSMGAWATGTNVSAALGRLGLIKSTGPETDKVLSVLDLLGPGYTYVITGYPPFLRTLLEQAGNLSGYRLYGFVGGEGMSENLRARLERSFRAVYSAYGASDLDIGIAAEFPLTVWLRKQAAASPALAEALFGIRGRLPMVFQYDPTDYYVETINGELVTTVCRPATLSPRIRYNVHDAGGTLSFDRMLEVCRGFGLDPFAGARARSAAPVLRMPLLYVHGRSDSTVSVHGANIYPEDVEWGLGESLDADAVAGFALDLAEDDGGVVRPRVHVETWRYPTAYDRGLADRLAAAVRSRLLTNSADFRSAVAEDTHAGQVLVALHAQGTGPFTASGSQIKRRYVR